MKKSNKQHYVEALVDALQGMLLQFGGNWALSAVEDSCALLNHPRSQSHKMDDCCYCRHVVYDAKEKRRRIKDKISFVDRVPVSTMSK